MAVFKVIFIYFISQTLIFLPKRYECELLSTGEGLGD